MSAVAEAAEALRQALRGVEGVQHYDDLGANVDPPATLLGAPRLVWEAVCAQPTSATFIAYLVVRNDDESVERLWQHVEAVADAIEGTDFAAVTEANPSTFQVGSVDLPAYELTIEAGL